MYFSTLKDTTNRIHRLFGTMRGVWSRPSRIRRGFMARRELVAEGTLEVSYQRAGLACLGHDAGGACGGGVTDYGVLGGGEDLGGLGLGGGCGRGGRVGTSDGVASV